MTALKRWVIIKISYRVKKESSLPGQGGWKKTEELKNRKTRDVYPGLFWINELGGILLGFLSKKVRKRGKGEIKD